MPPSTNARPKLPIDATPFGSDPTSREDDENSRKQKIPEKPAVEKPGPPVAPWVAKETFSAKEDGGESRI